MLKLMKNTVFLIMLGFLAANTGRDITNGCDLPDSEITGYLHLTADGSVLYKTPEDIGGFQFNVDGATINSASGGDAGAIGMFLNSNGNLLLAFSLTGSIIPEGCGTLVNLDLSGDATGLSGIIVSDAGGSAIYFEYYNESNSECPEGSTFWERFLEGQPDSLCVPDDFLTVNQSTLQAAYFFETVTLNLLQTTSKIFLLQVYLFH